MIKKLLIKKKIKRLMLINISYGFMFTLLVLELKFKYIIKTT